MANKTIPDYDAAGGIDAATDLFLIWQNATNTYRKITRNVILGTTGTPVDTSTVQTLSNKVLNNTNTVTLKDTLFTLQDDADITKQARFQLSSISAGATRTYTLPNTSSTLVDLATVQTLTNKTITAPTITGGSIDNSTVTVDSIAGHTSPTIVSVAGLSISAGVLNSANAVTTTSIANAAVTPAKWTNPYKFSVYRNAPTNSFNGVGAKVPFDTKLFDTNGNFSTATNRYTAPISGFYWFNGLAGNTAATGTIMFCSLYVNGTNAKNGNVVNPTVANNRQSVSGYLSLTAGDYVEMWFVGGAGSVITTGKENCYFEGYLDTPT